MSVEPRGTLAQRPASDADSRNDLYFATDGGSAGTGGLYQSNGAAWILLSDNGASVLVATQTLSIKDATLSTPAVGDGSTDDSAAFTALNALVAARVAAGAQVRVLIPQGGTYITTVGLAFVNATGVTVQIDGTIKLKSATLDGASVLPLVNIAGCTDVSVVGPGHIDGNRASQSGYSEQNPGIKITGSTGVSVRRVHVNNTAGDNIYVATSTSVWIEDNDLSDPNTGGAGNPRQGVAVVGGCSDIHINDNRFPTNSGGLVVGRMAIDIEPSVGNVDRVFIDGNTVTGAGWNRSVNVGTVAGTAVSRLRITNNDFAKYVRVDGSVGNGISSVHINNNEIDESIVVLSVNTIKVRGNTTKNRDTDAFKSACIYFSACAFVICDENVCQPGAGSPVTRGIWNEGATAYAHIHDNVLLSQGGAQMSGIVAAGALQVASIDGNVGAGNGGTPMPVGIDLAGLAGQSFVRVGPHNHFFQSVTAKISGQSKALGAAILNGRSVLEGGADATMGLATLVAGTVVVATTKVTATSRILLTAQALGTVAAPKAIAVTARTAGTSFTITSADATDTSTVAWEIVEPA